MRSLEAAKRLEVAEENRRDALARAARQMAHWNLAMPGVTEPLVWDFGLGEFARVGLVEYWIANEESAGYCGKYLLCFDGQSCPMHSHRIKHETFFLTRGEARLTIAGQERTLLPGDSAPIAPGVVHGFTAINGPALLLELSMPCDPADNVFVDPRIAQWHQRLLAG